VTLATPFWENFKGVMYGLSLETSLSSLKSVAFTVLELLAFNGQKFRGSRDPDLAHFGDCPKSILFGVLRGSYIPNLV